MQWSDIQFSPSDKTLRQFAGLCLLVFGVLSAVEALVRHRSTLAWVYAAIALTIGPLGLARPQAVKVIFVGWSMLAFPIGWLVSTVMLGVLYFGVFTPIALVFRITGRDVLNRRQPSGDTYWRPKPAARAARDYFRQS